MTVNDSNTMKLNADPCSYENVQNDSMRTAQKNIRYKLTQHSLNCLASIGEVKFNPHVSLVIVSFQ